MIIGINICHIMLIMHNFINTLIHYILKSNLEKAYFFCPKDITWQIRLLSTLNEISGILRKRSDGGWCSLRKKIDPIFKIAKMFTAIKDGGFIFVDFMNK